MIDDLKSFVTVVNEASLTRAANVLCVSQSAVSKRIQRLEEVLGVELFDRNSKPPKPTALANRIYEQALPLLRGFERLLDIAREDAPPSGTLRFGLPQVIADVVLVDAVLQMKSSFPSLDVRLRTEWSSGLVRMIETGALDAAVLMVPSGAAVSEDLSRHYIATLDVMVVQSKKKPLVKNRTSIKSLAAQEWVLNPLGCGYRAALERAMDGVGQRLRLSVDTHATDMQLRLISAGVGLGLVPKEVLAMSALKGQLSVVDVSDFKLSVDVWLVSAKELGNLRHAVNFLARSLGAYFGRRSRKTM
jgi:DNA-binding transcriptional LysR family regulator